MWCGDLSTSSWSSPWRPCCSGGRRTRSRRATPPLAMVAIAFPLFAIVDLAATVVGVTWDGPNPTALVLLLFPYALFRWGSGREATIGLAIVLSPVVAGAAAAPVGEVLGGTLI